MLSVTEGSSAAEGSWEKMSEIHFVLVGCVGNAAKMQNSPKNCAVTQMIHYKCGLPFVGCFSFVLLLFFFNVSPTCLWS